MSFTIDILAEDEKPMIVGWWKHHGVDQFCLDDLKQSKTYLLKIAGLAALCATVISTSARIAWVEAYVGNPAIPNGQRAKYTPRLLSYIEAAAVQSGAKKIMCFGPNEKLTAYYTGLGFRKTASVDILIKEIS